MLCSLCILKLMLAEGALYALLGSGVMKQRVRNLLSTKCTWQIQPNNWNKCRLFRCSLGGIYFLYLYQKKKTPVENDLKQRNHKILSFQNAQWNMSLFIHPTSHHQLPIACQLCWLVLPSHLTTFKTYHSHRLSECASLASHWLSRAYSLLYVSDYLFP